MTKAQMRKVAQQARQYGHLAHGHDAVSNATLLEVKCPRCSSPVTGYLSRYDTKANTVNKALDLAMVDHLTYDCKRWAVKVAGADGGGVRYLDGSYGSEADAQSVAYSYMELGYRALVEAI